MSSEFIHNRGRGPEIVGTRITVYNLLPNFLDPDATEEYVAKLYGLTVEQVAAARAYILNHADTVLARHLEIEARMAEGNPPEVVEQAKRTHERFSKFKEWLEKKATAERQSQTAEEPKDRVGESRLPPFREWVIQQSSHSPESL